MHNIIYTQNALFNMACIIENIVQYTGYESSGLIFQEDIEKNVNLLAIFPEMGTDGTIENTKEIFVIWIQSCIFIYRLNCFCNYCYSL